MKRTQIVLGVGVRALGILSVRPGLRATEPPGGDTNGKPIAEAFAPDVGAPVSSPFQITEKLSLGAVTEFPSDKVIVNPSESLTTGTMVRVTVATPAASPSATVTKK